MSVFSPQLNDKISALVKRYETQRSSILPILHAIQEEHDWVQEEHIDALESEFKFNRVHIKEVISFYDIYSSEPKKRYQIRFCNNITCNILGSQEVVDHLKAQVKKGDQRYKDCDVTPFPCLGKCDGAPVMLINKERYEHVNLSNVDEIVGKHVNGEA